MHISLDSPRSPPPSALSFTSRITSGLLESCGVHSTSTAMFSLNTGLSPVCRRVLHCQPPCRSLASIRGALSPIMAFGRARQHLIVMKSRPGRRSNAYLSAPTGPLSPSSAPAVTSLCIMKSVERKRQQSRTSPATSRSLLPPCRPEMKRGNQASTPHGFIFCGLIGFFPYCSRLPLGSRSVHT